MPDRQRVFKTHALVLRRRSYSDADRILTVLTPGFGKRQLIAKGIRKTTSRKAGHLELFTHAQLIVARGRTWDIVTEANTIESFSAIRGDLQKVGHAAYVCELIDSFAETDDENQLLWELILLVLRALDKAGVEGAHDNHVLLRWFELHLLSISGFQPQFFDCIDCGNEVEPTTNYLSLIDGGVICPACRQQRAEAESIDVDTLKVLRFLQTRSWNDVRKLSVRPHIMQRVDNLLHRYLLTVLERHLKSVDFMRRIENMRNAAVGHEPSTPSVESDAVYDSAGSTGSEEPQRQI